MKVKVAVSFHDFNINTTYFKNDEVELDNKVAEGLIKIGYVEQIAEEKAAEVKEVKVEKKERKTKTKVEE